MWVLPLNLKKFVLAVCDAVASQDVVNEARLFVFLNVTHPDIMPRRFKLLTVF